MYWTIRWKPTLCVQLNIFEELLKKLVGHIFMLLLAAPFVSKLVNHSRLSESLKIRKNSKSATFFFEKQWFVNVKAFFQRLAVSQVIGLIGQKRCQKKHEVVIYQLPGDFFQTRIVACVTNLFKTHIQMY